MPKWQQQQQLSCDRKLDLHCWHSVITVYQKQDCTEIPHCTERLKIPLFEYYYN